jgi:hypothetical protein
VNANATNEKRPRQGVSWAMGLLGPLLARERELDALALLEPGVFPLGGDLTENRGVKRRVRGLAARAGPVPFAAITSIISLQFMA